MNTSNSPSPLPSGSATPGSTRFTAQNATAEDILKTQTQGLVSLSDYRKRRLEAFEHKEVDSSSTPVSGASTPGTKTPTQQPKKKKFKKNASKVKLSFGVDEEEEEDGTGVSVVPTPRSLSRNPDDMVATDDAQSNDEVVFTKKKFGPRAGVSVLPKLRTKAAMIQEAQTRDKLRKEFLSMQEAVRATDIIIPFVFYDGTNTPGGVCKVKKGDHIWLFLDKARKLGAGLGIGGDKRKSQFARISVDDLMLVKGEIIVPHHHDFYYFMINKSVGFDNVRIFPYSAEPTAATPTLANDTESAPDPSNYNPLSKPVKLQDGLSQPEKKEKARGNQSEVPDEELEGFDHDPNLTKVVDRRWYERNKHVFPASVWENFDPAKDYSKSLRKDTEGNTFFFA